MKQLDSRALGYLATQRVGVLAVEMNDGSPHAATVHFAHASEPFSLYFETYREYRKAEPILSKESVRASFVIGTSESDMKTLQMDGLVELITPEEKSHYDEVYLGKFPEKDDKSKDDKFVNFKFTPTWWRYTDWKTPEGKLVLISE